MEKSTGELKGVYSLNEELTAAFRDYYERIDKERTRINQPNPNTSGRKIARYQAYDNALMGAKKAAQELQGYVLQLHLMIEQFNDEHNANLPFLNDLDAEKKREFIDNYKKNMQELFAACEDTIRQLLSSEFFDKKLISLYGSDVTYTNTHKSEAYRHIGENLTLLSPMIYKMKAALSDPSNVSKLNNFEESLITGLVAKNDPSVIADNDDRLRNEEARAKRRRNTIIRYSIAIALISLIAVGIIAATAITGGIALAVIGCAVAVVVCFCSVVSLASSLYYSIRQPAQAKIEPTKPVETKEVNSLSDKFKIIIQKIRDQFFRINATPDQSPRQKQEKAFFEKSSSKSEIEISADRSQKSEKKEDAKEKDFESKGPPVY